MVLRSTPLNVSFRKSLVRNNLQAWHNLVARVMTIQLTNQRDTFIWSLNQLGRFIVRSMHRALAVTNVVPHNHVIWKLEVTSQN